MGIFKFIFFIFFLLVINFGFKISNAQINDHEKAIEAVKSGEILPLDQILLNIKNQFENIEAFRSLDGNRTNFREAIWTP